MGCKKLSDLKINEKGIITEIKNEGYLKSRLIDMGIIPGTEITLNKVAPFGDPIWLNLRGYELSLRKKDAKKIFVK